MSSLCLVFTTDITANPLQPLKDYSWLNFKMYMFELMQRISLTWYQRLCQVFLGLNCFFSLNHRLTKLRVFCYAFYVNPQTQQQLAIDIENCQESIKTLHSFVNQNGIAVNSFWKLRLALSKLPMWLTSFDSNPSPSEITFKKYFFDYFNLIDDFSHTQTRVKILDWTETT